MEGGVWLTCGTNVSALSVTDMWTTFLGSVTKAQMSLWFRPIGQRVWEKQRGNNDGIAMMARRRSRGTPQGSPEFLSLVALVAWAQ
jgi:hypothetical protein